MGDIFITVLYQPFLNILVGFYWLVGHTPLGYDMGIAVILLTIFIRLLMLPLTLQGHRTEHERRAIEEQMREIEARYGNDPVRLKEESKKVFRTNPRILLSEGFAFAIQLAIALILWRIFGTGLSGEDLHLLYDWIPHPPTPYNLKFLGEFDLTHTHLILNLLQSLMIFLLETIAVITSPYPYTRAEVVRVQIILPVVSFLVFMFLPAGKKLFVITTLSFSILVMLGRASMQWWKKTFPPPSPEEETADTSSHAEEKHDEKHVEPENDAWNPF
jgi:YidC/Oxa1 family membrane protein insertase